MEKNLTTGSVFKTVLQFSLPYLLSYFLQTLYGMADLFIIGQFNGVDSTTADGHDRWAGDGFYGDDRSGSRFPQAGSGGADHRQYHHPFYAPLRLFDGRSAAGGKCYYCGDVYSCRSSFRHGFLSYNLFYWDSFYYCL